MAVGQKPDAGDVARVVRELPRRADDLFAREEGEDGADVVEAAGGDEAAGWGVRACHDPGGAELDGVQLVCREGVPHDELSVRRGADEVLVALAPMQGVDFGKMAFERPPCL